MYRSNTQPLYLFILEAVLDLTGLAVFVTGIAFLALGAGA